MHTYTRTHAQRTYTHIPVDFVLKDPRQKTQEATPSKLPHRLELEVVPKPWNQNFLAVTATMSEVLSVTNPTVAAVLRLWYQEYTHCRYVYMYVYVYIIE